MSNLDVGPYVDSGLKSRDDRRLSTMGRKSTEIVAKRRKKLRHIKKGFIDKEQEAEMVPAYSCGAF